MSETPKSPSRREKAEELRRQAHAATSRIAAVTGQPNPLNRPEIAAVARPLERALRAVAGSGAPGEDETLEESATEEGALGDGPVGIGGYSVEPGDSIASIAKDSGHFWRTIWDCADNAYLQEVRVNPNVLLPGDRVTIPELRQKDEHGQTEMRHRFRRRGEPSTFKMRVAIVDQPVAARPYTLVFDNVLSFAGTTDGEGNIEPTPIPSNVRRAELKVDMGENEQPLVYELQVGRLAPKNEIDGIQDRLTNMGFGQLESRALDAATRDALRNFQAKYGLEETGEPDEATQSKLVELHGS